VVFEGSADPVLTRMNSSLRASVPQLYLDVDRVKAKTLGVMIQADQQYRSRVEDVNRLEVRDRDGNMVPLSTLVTISDAAGPQTISRYNLYPSSTITGQPNPGYSSGQAIGAMEDLSERLLPQSMGYEWSGVTYQQIKAGSQAPFIFGLAIVFVFLFLAAQYESWSLPLAVILSVPLALLGGIFATWARAYDNNVYTQIGVVLLIGLAAKGAILIVEFAKEQRAAGKSIIEAATSAAHLRFRALLMTAFSFILGVVPLVIATGAGAGSRRALGTAVFGGMLASTALGVFFIPVLYVVVQRLAGHGRETEQTNHER
jgi:HAE1 family hydrophobic/amphiphilic exporter-1